MVPYITSAGRSHVLDFLAELEHRDSVGYAAYLYVKDLLIENGTDIGMPHWQRLGGGLGEIRWRSHKRRLRVPCCEDSGRRIVMLDGMPKKWRIFENADRKKCLARREDFRSPSYDQEKRFYLYLARTQPNVGNP
jgi:hypothetical protein